MASNSRYPAISILLLFTGLYLLTMRGTHTSVDDIPRYNLTISLLTSGTLEVPHSIMVSSTSVDGRIYSKYGIGMSLVMTPFHVLADAAPEALTRLMERPDVFAMSTTNQWLGALACMLLFLIARRVGFSERTALIVTLAAGLGSMLWLNAQTSFENVLVVVLIEIVVLVLVGRGALGVLAACGAGAAVGCIFPTRWGDGWILLPGAIALLAARLRTEGGGKSRRLAPAVAFAVPLLAGIAGAMAYNQARFLHPLEMGYDDDNVSLQYFHRGLFGFLFSPAKSVFVFTPLLALAIARFGRLWKRLGGGLRGTGLFWLIGAPLLVYSCFETWDGGWCFGPRYLLPSVVLAMLALGDWIEDARWQEALWRPALFGMLFLAGVYAQLVCLASDFNHYGEAYYSFRYYPEACPLWVLPKTYVYPTTNLWFLKILLTYGIGPKTLALFLGPLACLVLGVVGIRREAGAFAAEAGEFLRRGSPVLARVALGAAALVAVFSLAGGAARWWRSAPLPEGVGLTGAYFRSIIPTSPTVFVRREAPVDFDWSNGHRPLEGNFSVRWEGEIEAPAAGTYVFGLDACGTATLWIDGEGFLFNPGPQPGRRLFMRSTELTQGWHAIAVEFASAPAVDYYEFNGARYGHARRVPTGLELLWKPPGGWWLRTVPARALRPK